MTDPETTRQAVRLWRDALVGMTRRNSLLNFKAPKRSSVPIESRSVDDLFVSLTTGREHRVAGVVPPTGSDEAAVGDAGSLPWQTDASDRRPVLRTLLPIKDLGPALRNMMRRAMGEFLDKGLSVAYLSLGMLDWIDEDQTKMRSPLLLIPVNYVPTGPRSLPYVVIGEDDAVVNPALAIRMREFDFSLPAIGAEDDEDLAPSHFFQRLRELIAKRPELSQWTVAEEQYLALFSFAKEAMYRDLLENEDTIIEHPTVQALANSDPLSQASTFGFDPIDPTDIDRDAPPEQYPLVLDADSSQRSAIAAAVAGRSFVMDGPPGTGKSQTIANMIGALLHANKTVLFVSEKIAALDVVRNRLADVGLDNYLFELHSAKATRREVATELLRCLTNVTQAPPPMSRPSRAELLVARQKLNAYAEAMNEVRQPLNATVHDVLGELSRLVDTPLAPSPSHDLQSLSENELAGIRDLTKDLSRAWRPALQGGSYLWRAVRTRSPLDVELAAATSTLTELSQRLAYHSAVADAFDVIRASEVPRLCDILEHWHKDRPANLPEHWLTVADFTHLEGAREQLSSKLRLLNDADRDLLSMANVARTSMPDLALAPDVQQPDGLVGAPVDPTPMTAAQLRDAAQRFETTAVALHEALTTLNKVSDAWGLAPVATFASAGHIARMTEILDSGVRLEQQWMTPAGLATARADKDLLQQRSSAVDAAQQRAESRFTPEALRQPLAELQDRFTNLHTGLRKLSGRYRDDKRVIAKILDDGDRVKDGIAHLADAIAWQAADREFKAAAGDHCRSLGYLWQGRATDFSAVATALDTAEELHLLCPGGVPATLQTMFVTHADPIGAISAARSAVHVVTEWHTSLAPTPAVAGRPELALEPISASVEWLRVQVEFLRACAERIDAVESVVGSGHTLESVERIVSLHAAALAAYSDLQRRDAKFAAAFGDFYISENTDLQILDAALTWAKELRRRCGRSVSPDQMRALRDSAPPNGLMSCFDHWQSAMKAVVDAFDGDRQAELVTELDDFAEGAALLDAFRAESGGQQEWFAYVRARDELREKGLDPIVDFCVGQRLDAGIVSDVIDRAVLRAWVDAVVFHDDRLQPMLAADRESLVARYRELDQKMVDTAVSDIIAVVNSRRPTNTSVGEPAVIVREGNKKKRHLPVRGLVAKAQRTILDLKPVFMMSPLAVSQFLPTDIRFDVVIFDEGSQVTPENAMNCAYRGNALIIAGDDKQLPPTSFFENIANDEDENFETDVQDFQSILELSKASGAFNGLPLRWHYRSRHEDLIAFSNYKFYDGKLITYPSASFDRTDIGVDFFLVDDGVYRRGGAHDNPREAQRVAERVFQHLRDHPDLSIGVVTFSVAQADAVQTAIDAMRASNPDLERFFDTSDRLDGFFIRSLESVQGDERDIIILSLGYGPDEAGKITSVFGPLNKDKGWRRLNVAITRARRRVEVVASMRAADIPESRNENVNYLRAYLDYADRGAATLAGVGSSTGLAPESPFEESVIEVVRNWGYTVEPQVGAAGFRIDMAVRHPNHPGAYALGIECDGFQYHSAPAARDRDRLRQQVLEGLGWELHRIWGTAWYRDRESEQERLRRAIDTAIAKPVGGGERLVRATHRPAVEIVAAEYPDEPEWTVGYEVASPMQLPNWVDPSEPGNSLAMVDPIRHLVEIEGPIHMDVLKERLRTWWSIGKVGSKIQANINRAIKDANLQRDGDFIDLADRTHRRVRAPANGVERRAEQVHPAELAEAVRLLVGEVKSVECDDLVRTISRIFGWSKTGNLVDNAVRGGIRFAALNGLVEVDGNRLLPSKDTPLTDG